MPRSGPARTKLTVEQRMQNKRDEDKARQRLHRERTKAHIRRLEEENETLNNRLEAVERERDRLQAVVARVTAAVAPPQQLTPEPWYTPITLDAQLLEGHMFRVQDTVAAVWMIAPTNGPPTCPFDIMISEIEKLRARFATEQLDLPELSPDTAPFLSAAPDSPTTFESRPQDLETGGACGILEAQPRHDCSRQPNSVFSNMLVDFVTMGMPSLRTDIIRLAAVSNLFHFIRWRLCLSQDTYAALPSHYRPTATQRAIAHPAWMDLIPWPAARDQVILNLQPGSYARFRHMLHETYTIRWHKPASACLASRPATGKVTFSAEFLEHLKDLENFAMMAAGLDEFPFLKGAVNMATDDWWRSRDASESTSP